MHTYGLYASASIGNASATAGGEAMKQGVGNLRPEDIIGDVSAIIGHREQPNTSQASQQPADLPVHLPALPVHSPTAR